MCSTAFHLPLILSRNRFVLPCSSMSSITLSAFSGICFPEFSVLPSSPVPHALYASSSEYCAHSWRTNYLLTLLNGHHPLTDHFASNHRPYLTSSVRRWHSSSKPSLAPVPYFLLFPLFWITALSNFRILLTSSVINFQLCSVLEATDPSQLSFCSSLCFKHFYSSVYTLRNPVLWNVSDVFIWLNLLLYFTWCVN